MTDLEKYNLVNSCETVEELTNAVLALTDEDGMIQGRIRAFDGRRMAENVNLVVTYGVQANVLTREFGIRQQALYIAYYTAIRS